MVRCLCCTTLPPTPATGVISCVVMQRELVSTMSGRAQSRLVYQVSVARRDNSQRAQFYSLCFIVNTVCPVLGDPRNGEVSVSAYGTTATYSCDRGYKLEGNKQRTCSYGVWSGSEPHCKKGKHMTSGGLLLWMVVLILLM